MLGEPGLDGAGKSVPAGQQHAALRPAEHPGNGAQVLDPPGGLARSRTAADVELGDLGDRRGHAEVLEKTRRVVDQPAIRPIGIGAERIHDLGVALRRRVGGVRVQQARLQRGRDQGLQILAPE